MNFNKSVWTSYGVMTLFVLLWGSAAIFTRWGLDHGTPFALLIVRFTLALGAVVCIGLYRGRLWPVPGSGPLVLVTGFLMVGCYSICYFQAMAFGITPGVMATLLGVQPILTLLLLERRFSPLRLAGLLLALVGLSAVVFQSLVLARFSIYGMLFAAGALLCMTFGAIFQRRIRQSPVEVLPLQYAASVVLCLLFVPFQPVRFEAVVGFVVPVLWLGLVISVAAQLLLYRMIQTGNLVNVTSLFYLVPVVTVGMDYLFLGNALSRLGLLGMGAILVGLALVFRAAPQQRS
ncbi:DMT family transporter [Stutzerimonas chloritidismutans]|uniref:DMT family transporter n=1 Tax=Stutzerimonas chloritidismutans TaxID=203192 RepID=UPI003F17EDAF